MSLILGWITRIYDTLLTVLRLAGERLAALAAERRQQ
jgi:hypothetical protein